MLKYFKVLIFFVGAQNAQAFSKGHSEFTYFDKYAYNFVMSSCRLNLESLATFVESTKKDTQEYFYLLNPNNYLNNSYMMSNNIIDRKGIGKTAARLLDSYGYYVALRECFPQSEAKRNLYTGNLLLFDAFGKVSALSIVGSAGYLGSWAVLFVVRRSLAIPLEYVFQRLGASKAFLEKIPSWTDLSAKAGLLTLAVFVMGREVEGVTATMQKNREQQFDATQENQTDLMSSIGNLNENLQLYQSIQKLEREAAGKQKTQLEAYKKQQRYNVKYYLSEVLQNPELSNLDRQKYSQISKEFEGEAP